MKKESKLKTRKRIKLASGSNPTLKVGESTYLDQYNKENLTDPYSKDRFITGATAQAGGAASGAGTAGGVGAIGGAVLGQIGANLTMDQQKKESEASIIRKQKATKSTGSLIASRGNLENAKIDVNSGELTYTNNNYNGMSSERAENPNPYKGASEDEKKLMAILSSGATEGGQVLTGEKSFNQFVLEANNPIQQILAKETGLNVPMINPLNMFLTDSKTGDPYKLKSGGYPRRLKMASGGEVSGPGGPKEDKINAEIEERGFVVPAENADLAIQYRREYLGKPKKAALHSGNVPVKLSDGEHYFTEEEVAVLRNKGVDLDSLAPNGKNISSGAQMAEGGGEQDKITINGKTYFIKNIRYNSETEEFEIKNPSPSSVSDAREYVPISSDSIVNENLKHSAVINKDGTIASIDQDKINLKYPKKELIVKKSSFPSIEKGKEELYRIQETTKADKGEILRDDIEKNVQRRLGKESDKSQPEVSTEGARLLTLADTVPEIKENTTTVGASNESSVDPQLDPYAAQLNFYRGMKEIDKKEQEAIDYKNERDNWKDIGDDKMKPKPITAALSPEITTIDVPELNPQEKALVSSRFQDDNNFLKSLKLDSGDIGGLLGVAQTAMGIAGIAGQGERPDVLPDPMLQSRQAEALGDEKFGFTAQEKQLLQKDIEGRRVAGINNAVQKYGSQNKNAALALVTLENMKAADAQLKMKIADNDRIEQKKLRTDRAINAASIDRRYAEKNKLDQFDRESSSFEALLNTGVDNIIKTSQLKDFQKRLTELNIA